MITKLPKPIQAYFHAANEHDSKSLSQCFSEDAVVYDEGEEYHGHSDIKEWNEASSKKYAHTLEVTCAVEENGENIVTAKVSGNFEGSPASIDFHFTLENEKIISLYCG